MWSVTRSLEDVGDHLERLRVERRVHERRDEREDARVRTDVEHHVCLPREPREEFERERVRGVRQPSGSPVELLRDLAPIGIEHHEPRVVEAARDLVEARGSRQTSSSAEARAELYERPQERMRDAHRERPLHVLLEAEPAVPAALARLPKIAHASIHTDQVDSGSKPSLP